jgi:pentatricopeptide repeat protein
MFVPLNQLSWFRRVTSCRKDGIDQAVNCLQWMRNISAEGDAAATPDIVKYTTIISAYARAGSPDRATAMLELMIEDFLDGNDLAKPDYKAFDIVVSACTSNTGSLHGQCSGWLAEKIVRRMWVLYESGKLRCAQPKATMYKNLIIYYKKAAKPEKAELLLREMAHYNQNGMLDFGPNKKLFQTVVNAWHESSRPDKQLRLQSLRADMSDLFGRRGEGSRYFHHGA